MASPSMFLWAVLTDDTGGIMAERRYGFRCSFSEGCLLLVSLLLTSSLVFLFGVYVGKASEARKEEVQQTEVARLPIVGGKESPSPRSPAASSPRAPLPPEKLAVSSSAKTPLFADAIEEPPAPLPPTSTVTVKAEPPILPSPKKDASVKPPARLPIDEEDASFTDEQPARKPARSSDSFQSAEKPARKPAPAPKVKAAEVKPAAPPKKVVASVKPAPAPQRALSPATSAPTRREKPVASSSGRWSIQVQETKQQETVQQTIRHLRAQGYAPIVIKAMKSGEIWYRVRVGKFRRQEEAVAAIADIRRGGRFAQAFMVSE